MSQTTSAMTGRTVDGPLSAPNQTMRPIVNRKRKGEQDPGQRAAISYWAVAVAATSALIASAVYYSLVFGTVYQSLRGTDPSASPTPQIWTIAAQLGRNLVVVLALAVLLRRLRVDTVPEALRWGLLVWFGFEAMAIVGSVIHEQYPFGLYALHAGDAFMATLLMTFVLSVRRRTSPID